MVLPASSSRQVLVWSLPTAVFVLSILWYRRRLRSSKRQTDPGGSPDSDSATVALATQQPEAVNLESNGISKSADILDITCGGEEKCNSFSYQSDQSVTNHLYQVIPTQGEIKSNLATAADNTDKSITIEDIVLISDKSVNLKSDSKKVKDLENYPIALEEKVNKEGAKDWEQESSSISVEEAEIKPMIVTDTNCVSFEVGVINNSTDKLVVDKVVQSTPVERFLETVVEETPLREDPLPTEMTEVEEPTAVATKGSVGESGDSAPLPVLTKISVDVSASAPKQTEEETSSKEQTVSHQPRDSANHSPAEAMLASPSMSNDSDTHSVGSNDSGKGGSDVTTPVLEEGAGKSAGRVGSSRRTSTSSRSSACSESGRTPRQAPASSSSSSSSPATAEQKPLPVTTLNKQPCVFEFVIPQQLVGRLIGKHGCFVQQIKSDTNSSIFVKRHPESPKYKVCAVEGTQADIEEALKLIRKKFPVKKYPSVTLERVMFLPPSGSFPLIPESLQMYLVEGVNNDVIMSSLVSAGHMFLQQPTHPTFPVLSRLIMSMTQCYTEDESPTLPNPAPGIVCAAPSMGGWYRAEVIDVRTEVGEEREGEEKAEECTVCDIKFVDYGGFMTLPTSELRQIRTDFMMLPFQATECYLADVTWLDGEEGWSEQATQCVEELTRDQVLQAQVVGYAENCTPFIRLFSSIHGPMAVMVNEMLVHRGLAKYFEPVVA